MSLNDFEHTFGRFDGGPGYRKPDITNQNLPAESELKEIDPVAADILTRLKSSLGGDAIASLGMDKTVFQIPPLPDRPAGDTPQSPADERAQNPDGTYDF